MVRLHSLSRAYREGDRERRVLDGLNAAVDEGEYIAIVGRSGCGKSTLLNIISGIDRPDTGRVEIAAQDVTAMSERDRTLFRRRHVGFVYQFFNLIPTLTVLENLCLPLALNGREPAGAQAQALDMLARIALQERAASFPDALSGGEQQRVALARALVHEPRLILADEPTGNLDADSGEQVVALLDCLVRAAGATLILVTHSEPLAARADRVLYMAQGRLQVTG